MIDQTVDNFEYEDGSSDRKVIDMESLRFLLDRNRKLTLLENAGVDNWEGYSCAMQKSCKHSKKLK